MNILFDHQIFSFQRYGGVSRYFYEIANRIAALPGTNVEIFAPLYVNEYFRHDCKVRPRGIKTAPFPRSARIFDAVNNSVSRCMVKPRQDADVFHETYYSLADFCPRSAKRVVTVYDMIHEKFAGYFPDAAETQRVKAHAVRRADRVICISDNTKRDLVEYLSVAEDTISVVHLGCSLSLDSDRNSRTPAVSRKPYILSVGARAGYKNFEGLLRAYASSSYLKSDFALVCFGGGKFSLRELALMRSLGISKDAVQYLSGTDDLLARLYTAAAAFVYPSLYEGFGLPALEAMSLGCPVVCANTGSIPEVVGDAAELFNPSDESEMCAAIERVVSSPDYAAVLVEKGRRRASLFSWEKCALDTLGVYHKVLEG